MNKHILAISAMFFLGFQCSKKPYVINYYIPKDYEGVVLLVYNEENCPLLEERSYFIPENGILKIKNSPNYGYHKTNYYQKNKSGELAKIDFVFIENLKYKYLDTNKVIVYKEERGNFYSMKKKRNIVFDMFFISKVRNVKKMGWAEQRKINLIEDSDCR